MNFRNVHDCGPQGFGTSQKEACLSIEFCSLVGLVVGIEKVKDIWRSLSRLDLTAEDDKAGLLGYSWQPCPSSIDVT